MPDNSLNDLPSNRAVRLYNRTCVYCGCLLESTTSTKEHVIGKRFVPRGMLDGQWNLLVDACHKCNGRKADLEDDISAITMQPDVLGNFADKNDALVRDAIRKGDGCRSRRTKKPVNDSCEKFTISGQICPGVELTASFVGPPQLNAERIFSLAQLHIGAFFYFISFNAETRQGGFCPGRFYAVLNVRRQDWGNIVHHAFMESVADWGTCLLGIGASGFFKVVIRRHPLAECWSWALEWNKQLRVIGFFGDEAAARAIVEQFPRPKATIISKSPEKTVRCMLERPFAEAGDRLFHCD